MDLTRQILEEYLDGELPPGQLAAIDQQLRRDISARVLLERIKAERNQRQIAFESYTPTNSESEQLAEEFMQQCREETAATERDVIGRIAQKQKRSTLAYWSRRISAAAAILLLMAGSFMIGRFTDSSPVMVQVVSPDGQVESREFATMEEAKEYTSQQQTIQTASLDVPGLF